MNPLCVLTMNTRLIKLKHWSLDSIFSWDLLEILMKLSSPFMFWRKRRFCLQLEVNGFDCLKSICFCPPYLLVKLNLKKESDIQEFHYYWQVNSKKKSFLLNCICIPYFPGQSLTYLVNLGTVFWEILTGKPGNKHWHWHWADLGGQMT